MLALARCALYRAALPRVVPTAQLAVPTAQLSLSALKHCCTCSPWLAAPSDVPPWGSLTAKLSLLRSKIAIDARLSSLPPFGRAALGNTN